MLIFFFHDLVSYFFNILFLTTIMLSRVKNTCNLRGKTYFILSQMVLLFWHPTNFYIHFTPIILFFKYSFNNSISKTSLSEFN